MSASELPTIVTTETDFSDLETVASEPGLIMSGESEMLCLFRESKDQGEMIIRARCAVHQFVSAIKIMSTKVYIEDAKQIIEDGDDVLDTFHEDDPVYVAERVTSYCIDVQMSFGFETPFFPFTRGFKWNERIEAAFNTSVYDLCELLPIDRHYFPYDDLMSYCRANSVEYALLNRRATLLQRHPIDHTFDELQNDEWEEVRREVTRLLKLEEGYATQSGNPEKMRSFKKLCKDIEGVSDEFEAAMAIFMYRR